MCLVPVDDSQRVELTPGVLGVHNEAREREGLEVAERVVGVLAGVAEFSRKLRSLMPV